MLFNISNGQMSHFPFALTNALKHTWALNLTKSIVSHGMLVNHIIKDNTWALCMGGTIGILEQEIVENKQSGKIVGVGKKLRD